MVSKNGIDAARGLGLQTLLAGLIPGLLQLRLGLRRHAAIAFVGCTVLFFIGWFGCSARLFYWALVAYDDTSGPVLSMLAQLGIPTLPEMLNLPANALGALLAFDPSPTGLRIERLPTSYEYIGGWLTGASGMLAAFWAAHGHWELRLRRDAKVEPDAELPRPAASPALCAALSWLLPGLGHARAGQKEKGVLLGVAVLLVFVLGMICSGGHAVDRANYQVWWIAQNLFGGGSLFAALVTGPMETGSRPFDLDLGIILCTVAGLMNLVVMCDAYTVAERTVFPVADDAGAAEQAEVSA